jgi:hypothetical protein
MFISCTYEKTIRNKWYTWWFKILTPDKYQFKIIDSDFECIMIAYNWYTAVIDTYEKRKLNVAANLVLALIYLNKDGIYSIEEMIKYNIQHTLKFAKYKKDIEKYMVLL